jgi:hypothetical protein
MSVIEFKGFGKTVTDAHRDEQYGKLRGIIQTTFTSQDRVDKLLKMYDDLETRILEAPASSKVQYHNAYPGGYLDHIHNVIRTAELCERLYRHVGGKIDFTPEERVFAAMHHDLYKLGDENGPFYIRESDNYWIKKGSVYKYSEDLDVMHGVDRTFYMLQKYGIEMTYKEMVGIKCADGLYDRANEKYFMAQGVFPNRTQIHLVIHWADCMAANAEKGEMQEQYV